MVNAFRDMKQCALSPVSCGRVFRVEKKPGASPCTENDERHKSKYSILLTYNMPMINGDRPAGEGTDKKPYGRGGGAIDGDRPEGDGTGRAPGEEEGGAGNRCVSAQETGRNPAIGSAARKGLIPPYDWVKMRP